MIQYVIDYIRLKHHQKNMSLKKLKRYQLKQIQKIFNYAVKHSPYYQLRDQHKNISDFHSFEKLDIINKHIMMTHFSQLNTCKLNKEDVMSYALKKEAEKDYKGYYKDQYVVGLSSGTSGNKGLYITPKKLTKRLPGVFLARSGLSLKDLPMRILFCLRVFSQGFNDINAPFIKLKYASTMTDPHLIVDMINSNNINVLMAPPSFLRCLLPFKASIKVNFKKVITYAEVLSKADQAQFEQAFKTKVIEIYQASEGQIASCCSEGKLHINEDLVYVEIYDQTHNKIDEPHKIGHYMLITNLVNYAQPLIRYQMNDMIVLDEPCACKSAFKTIKQVMGRSDDLIYFMDKFQQPSVVFPDLFARWIITYSDDIREFQAIQHTYGLLDLTLDCILPVDTNGLMHKLKHFLSELGLKGDFDIKIGTISLPNDANKYKRFISKVKI